jgi:hypothetical protein
MKFYDFTGAPNPRRVRIFWPRKVSQCRWMQIPTKSPANSEMMSPGDTR